MRLLTLSLSEIEEEIKKIDNESKALRKDIYKLAWFMRGSVSIEQAFGMDIGDRNIVSDLIKENLETTKESGLPFF
jgi:hypothetical protein